jgi:hypothetical protein
LQPDFAAQKCALEEVVDDHNQKHKTNHLIDFLPKFHPELNPIERYWAALKHYMRNNTPYASSGLRRLLPTALTEAVPEVSFGRYFRKTLRMMSAYRLGCSYALAAFAATRYKQHRGLPSDATYEMMLKEMARWKKEEYEYVPPVFGDEEIVQAAPPQPDVDAQAQALADHVALSVPAPSQAMVEEQVATEARLLRNTKQAQSSASAQEQADHAQALRMAKQLPFAQPNKVTTTGRTGRKRKSVYADLAGF